MDFMYVLHPESEHKDLPQKRPAMSSDKAPKKNKLTVNEDLKVAMMACSTEDDVQALIDQFQAKE